jgi:hypothetical protein
MTKKQALFVLGCLINGIWAYSQVQYNQIFDQNIKTVQVKLNGENLSHPVLSMNSEDVLKFSFDELSYDAKSYSYKIQHCNADWTPSSISEFEYVDGLNLADINDNQQSVNSMVDYTHYEFQLPNEDIKPKISGNYVVTVFESSDPDTPCFSVRFYVVEQDRTTIDATIRANTDIGVRTKYQQLEFDITTRNYSVQDPFSELKICVRQNGRTDNEVTGIKPTYISESKYSYTNNRAIIFDAGNEYRSLEISNVHILDDNVSSIKYIAPYYHVDMVGDKLRSNKMYLDVNDVDGKYVINLQQNDYPVDLEADYLFVHFSLPMDSPFFDGSIHLIGGFDSQLINDQTKMQYMNSTKNYQQTLLLKQGGYNYMYLYVPTGSTKGSTAQIEGDFWETENEYEIFVYHRPTGGRFDRLIGYRMLSSK